MYKMKEGEQYLRMSPEEILNKFEINEYVLSGSNWIYPFDNEDIDMSKATSALVLYILASPLIKVMYAKTI